MKPLFVFLLMVISMNAFSQTDSRIFYSRLMVVFSDLENNFEFLKGEIRQVDGTDTLFESNSFLEGTKDNNILSSSGVYAYQAMILDSASEAGSQLVLQAWKEKLANALTGSFSQPEKRSYPEKDNTDGYQYSSEKIMVLLLRHKADDASYWINLIIKTK